MKYNVSFQEMSRLGIQTALRYLEGSAAVSALDKNDKRFKREETEVLRQFAETGNLWVNVSIDSYVSEGATITHTHTFFMFFKKLLLHMTLNIFDFYNTFKKPPRPCGQRWLRGLTDMEVNIKGLKL